MSKTVSASVGQSNVTTNDQVNHPKHYTSGKVECIEAIESALGTSGYVDFLRGNIIKYVWRGPLKGKELEDYKKASWYITKLIEATSNE